jgi:NTP pyrophosphatase (non-canonical NTP hydrolase)
MKTLEDIRQRAAKFADDRDWQQFQSPKNLAMALSVEVAELLEHFQWLTEAQSKSLEPETLAEVADEIADVQLYLVRLADELNIDIAQSVANKADKNELKYPVDKVKGSAKKYTRY